MSTNRPVDLSGIPDDGLITALRGRGLLNEDDDLSDIPTDNLADELRERGYVVEPSEEKVISDADTDHLTSELDRRGYQVIDPDEDEFAELGAYVRDRHSEQHRGTILTCTDDVCDNYVRLGGAS